jgi:hypothetical protein
LYVYETAWRKPPVAQPIDAVKKNNIKVYWLKIIPESNGLSMLTTEHKSFSMLRIINVSALVWYTTTSSAKACHDTVHMLKAIIT